MRFITPLLLLALATVSACKDDVESSDTLGKFEITIDGEATEISSYAGPENRRSGIMVVRAVNHKILIVEGAAGIQEDGEPVLPLLSITLISDATGENLALESARYTLEEAGTVFVSDGHTGQQTLGNLVLEGGKIGFDLSLDLVPRAPNSAGRKVVEGVAPIRIEGRFSGAKTFVGIND